jgi:acyl carrier protein
MEDKIKIRLLKLLIDFIDENEIDIDKDIVLDENTRLIGTSSVFDSMELVQFIVEVESLLDDEFDIEIELTSEKAMSRRNSPFISINTLIKFILDES